MKTMTIMVIDDDHDDNIDDVDDDNSCLCSGFQVPVTGRRKAILNIRKNDWKKNKPESLMMVLSASETMRHLATSGDPLTVSLVS